MRRSYVVAAAGWSLAACLVVFIAAGQTARRDGGVTWVLATRSTTAAEDGGGGGGNGGGGASESGAQLETAGGAPSNPQQPVLAAQQGVHVPGTRYMDVVDDEAPLLDPHRFRIGVSLIVMERKELLQPAITSLVASEMATYNYTIYYWCNKPGSEAALYMKSLRGVPVVEVPNPTGGNAGIVIPRVRIMEAMMAATPRLDYFMEMHDDMYFFPATPWVSNLLKFDAPDTGILMPFIFNANTMPADAAAVLPGLRRDGDPRDARAGLVAAHVLYYRCIQVHPWFLKRALIEEVGYYDLAFSPHEMEDDDLMYRTLTSGWRAVAVRASWALHYGAATRGLFLATNTNHSAVFVAKHHVNYDSFRLDYLERHCHPAVYAVKPTLQLGFLD